MTTANDLIARSYRLANIVGLTETVSPEQYDSGLDTLNELLDAWRDEDIDLGLYAVTTATTIPGQYVRHLRYNLSMEFAMESGLDIDPLTAQTAAVLKNQLQDPVIPNMQIDYGLLQQRRFNINTGR